MRDALHELADRDLVLLHSAGSSTTITLCNESTPIDGDGEPNLYIAPYGTDPYLSVPRAFWLDGLPRLLSGAGVAMYLCALALTRSDEPEFFLSAKYFDARYGISRSSRKRGLAELAEHGVITIRIEESLDPITFRKVRRNIYRLTKRYRLPPAWTSPPTNDETDSAPAAPGSRRRPTQMDTRRLRS